MVAAEWPAKLMRAATALCVVPARRRGFASFSHATENRLAVARRDRCRAVDISGDAIGVFLSMTTTPPLGAMGRALGSGTHEIVPKR